MRARHRCSELSVGEVDLGHWTRSLPPEATVEPLLRLPITHAHIRGPDYYRTAAPDTALECGALELPLGISLTVEDLPC